MRSSSVAAVVDTAGFRVALAELVRRAQGAGVEAELLVTVHDQARELCSELERRRHRRATIKQIERMRELQHQLREYEPGARVAIICRRLGVGRTRYFELSKLAASPPAKADCQVVQSAADPARRTR
jgi:hypothetical protein